MTSQKLSHSKNFRIVTLAVSIVILVGLSFGIYQFMRKSSDLSRVKPDFVLNSTDLYAEYEKDEMAANAKYSGRILEVKGNVAQIEYGSIDSTLNITLRPDDQFSGVICTFSDRNAAKLTKLQLGETLTVRGECSGLLLDVLLNNCAPIVSPEN